jgi:acyl-CoA synthetase (AMP-forming)/AMP-acid ligase II
VESIAEYLHAQQVTRYKIPEEVVVVDELPMTPTGKVRKVALQQDARWRVEQAEAKGSRA